MKKGPEESTKKNEVDRKSPKQYTSIFRQRCTYFDFLHKITFSYLLCLPTYLPNSRISEGIFTNIRLSQVLVL